jgi:hypothetical protein
MGARRLVNADTQHLGQPHNLEFHWFAKMTTIDSEPRPGTAFKKIVEEQAMMDEFMAMIGKKYVLICILFRYLIALYLGWRLINGSKNPKIGLSAG